MRKEDNREKYKEYDHRYYIKHRRPNSKIGKLETKISDLEAKLAESEKEKEFFKEESKINKKDADYYFDEYRLYKHKLAEKEKLEYTDTIKFVETSEPNIVANELDRLNKQLAEKDEEIAYLTKQVKKFNNEAQKYFEDAYCNDFHNQDKISFAIAELEKVKDYAQHIQGGLINYIENQINRLKGEK